MAALDQAGAHVERFLESLPERAVYERPGPRDEAMHAFAIPETPGSIDAALQTVERYVDGIGHNLGSSRFFAYIPSGGLYESALADYVAAVSNRYSGVGAAAPGATRMEDALLKWLARIVGYPESAEGDLTSGGSMATLSALVAAREACGIRSSQVASSVVYVTAHTHHTFRKALHVTGLGECPIREIPCDDGLRMDVHALGETIRKDREAGLRPWLIGATAGTTDAGAVDPWTRSRISPRSSMCGCMSTRPMGAHSLCARRDPAGSLVCIEPIHWSSILTRGSSCLAVLASCSFATVRSSTTPTTRAARTCRTWPETRSARHAIIQLS